MLNSSGLERRGLAIFYGTLCHGLFLLAVGFAMVTMYMGMTPGYLVHLPKPLAALWDGLLLLQFPLLHSFLLTRKGGGKLARLAPKRYAGTLSTTLFATAASLQMCLLYLCWSPVGSVWWKAEGLTKAVLTALYLGSWLLLGKSMVDSSLAVQAGYLGWLSLFRGRQPNYPDMPETGLFQHCRHPIYLAYILIVWTVPVWTPDQLAVALCLTTYCLLGPLHKEARYLRRYGPRFESYRSRTPYLLPRRS